MGAGRLPGQAGFGRASDFESTDGWVFEPRSESPILTFPSGGRNKALYWRVVDMQVYWREVRKGQRLVLEMEDGVEQEVGG